MGKITNETYDKLFETETEDQVKKIVKGCNTPLLIDVICKLLNVIEGNDTKNKKSNNDLIEFVYAAKGIYISENEYGTQDKYIKANDIITKIKKEVR